MSKLIKRTNGRYDLYYSDDINQLNTIASTQHELNVSKLSVKNCEDIKNGYDLDELAKDYANGKSSSDVFKNAHEKDFIAGFQKALEILGDKKFSEEDMKKSFEYGATATLMNSQGRYNLEKVVEVSFKESLQQTEWDVEIELDTITTDDLSSIIGKPKFDSDGCLILKRK